MKEYIERSKVEEMLENAHLISDGEYCGYCTEDVCLANIPSVDVVPVVRCFECAKRGKSNWYPGMVYCRDTSTYKCPDDFCSGGEREIKEEQNEQDREQVS